MNPTARASRRRCSEPPTPTASTACLNLRVAITALRLNSPDLNTMPGASLQALSVTSSDRVVIGDKLEMKLGSELQTIQFMGRVNAFKPFGSADLHITPNTVAGISIREFSPEYGTGGSFG